MFDGRAVADEVERSGDLGGDGDEADVAAGGLASKRSKSAMLRAAGCPAGGWTPRLAWEMKGPSRWMPMGVAWSWLRGWRFDCVGDAFEGFQGLVDGGGYCGGEVAAYSFCC